MDNQVNTPETQENDGYTHDPMVGAVYVKVKEGAVASTKSLEGGIIVDFDENRNLLGVELLDDEIESIPCEWISEQLNLNAESIESLDTASMIILKHHSPTEV